MIPGMIGGHAAPAPVLTYLGSASNSSNGAFFSFTGKTFGAAAPDRRIIVAYVLTRAGTFGVSATTIGGVSTSSSVAETSSDGNRVRVGIIHAAVPTGTSGDINLLADQVCEYCAVAWFSVTGLDATAASDTASDDHGDPLSAAIDVLAGGFAIGVAASNTSTGWTWSGLDEVVDVAPEGGDRFGVAWREFPGGVSGQTVTADPTSDAVECMAIAAWR